LLVFGIKQTSKLPAQRARILPTLPYLGFTERPRPRVDCALVAELDGIRPSRERRHPDALRRRPNIDSALCTQQPSAYRIDGGGTLANHFSVSSQSVVHAKPTWSSIRKKDHP